MDPKDAVGMVLGAVALTITLYQARKTSQILLSSIVMKFLDEYSSPTMRNALDALEDFQHEQAQLLRQFQTLFAACYDRHFIPSQTADLTTLATQYRNEHEARLGRSRSKVAWFFSKAWRLHQHGFIDTRTLDTIFALDGAKVFVEVACPLTLAIRFSKIHNGDISGYLRDRNVLWYKNASSHITSSHAIAMRTSR